MILTGLGDPTTVTYNTGVDGNVIVVTTVDFDDPDAVWLSHVDHDGTRRPWTRLPHAQRDDLTTIADLGQNTYRNGTLLKIDSTYYRRNDLGQWTVATPTTRSAQPAPTVTAAQQLPGALYIDRRADSELWTWDDGEWVAIGTLDAPPEGFSPNQASVNPPEDCVSQGGSDIHAVTTNGTIVAVDTDSGLWKVAHGSIFLGFGNDETDTAGSAGDPIYIDLTKIIRSHSVLDDGNFYYVTGFGPAGMFQGTIAGEEVAGFIDSNGALRGFDGSWITLALANDDSLAFNFSLQVSND